jgi:hypothetical protein
MKAEQNFKKSGVKLMLKTIFTESTKLFELLFSQLKNMVYKNVSKNNNKYK